MAGLEERLKIYLKYRDGLNSRILLYKAELYREENDLSKNENKIHELEEALSNIKNNSVISSIYEFRNIQKELKLYKSRVIYLKQIIENNKIILESLENELSLNRNTIDIIKNKIESNSKKENVIQLRKPK